MIDNKTIFYFIVLFMFAPFAWSAGDLIFSKNSKWEVVSDGHQVVEGMAWDLEGNFYFTDVPRGQLFKIDQNTNKRSLVVAKTGGANGIYFGPDGRLYGCARDANGIGSWNISTWEMKVHGLGAQSNDLAILDDGSIFFTDPKTNSIWQLDGKTKKRSLAISLDYRPNGITLSPDKKTLYVAAFLKDTIFAYSINSSGKVASDASVAYVLAVPSDGKGRLDGMQILANGKLIIGTALGIQIVPPFGQESKGSKIIIPHPENGLRCNNVKISPDGKWLYACFINGIYRRQLSLK